MHRNARIVCGLILLGLAAATSASAQPILHVQVVTDYEPGLDFTAVSVRVCEMPRLSACQSELPPAFITERDAYSEGRIVGSFRVRGFGDYQVSVQLLNSTGNFMARQEVVQALRVNQHVTTIVLDKPATEATKKGEIEEDRDGDGQLSAGDVLRYEVNVRSATRFTDTPGPGGRLIPGTVTTTHGTVSLGNGPTDTRVEVRDLSDSFLEQATITFDVEVLPVVSNQGTAFVDPAGGRAELAIVRTDDPDTPAVLGDATVDPVACSFSTCGATLEECQRERDELADRLADVFADSDLDGVPAMLDLCVKTPAGEKVDDRGCSQAQFCGRVDAAKPDGEAICAAADWRGDEPLGDPDDCRAKDGACLVAE